MPRRSWLCATTIGLVLAGSTHTARADLRIAIGNDVFTDLDPPINDDGFTTDTGIALWRPYRGYLVGGSLLHRWLTEIGGLRRWDQVELLATVERPWGRYLVAGARLGPTFGGNLGGRWIQNGWHTLIGDRTLGHGLQDTYPGDNRVAALAGARLRATVGTVVQGYGGLDGQVALGSTGLTMVEAAAGGRVVGRRRCVEVAAHVELAIARYDSPDSNFSLPGGYGVDDWEPAWRAGLDIAWRRLRVGYEWRANEGGSGEPIGVITVTIAEAGTTFTD